MRRMEKLKPKGGGESSGSAAGMNASIEVTGAALGSGATDTFGAACEGTICAGAKST